MEPSVELQRKSCQGYQRRPQIAFQFLAKRGWTSKQRIFFGFCLGVSGGVSAFFLQRTIFVHKIFSNQPDVRKELERFRHEHSIENNLKIMHETESEEQTYIDAYRAEKQTVKDEAQRIADAFEAKK
eukprot:141052_1